MNLRKIPNSVMCGLSVWECYKHGDLQGWTPGTFRSVMECLDLMENGWIIHYKLHLLFEFFLKILRVILEAVACVLLVYVWAYIWDNIRLTNVEKKSKLS